MAKIFVFVSEVCGLDRSADYNMTSGSDEELLYERDFFFFFFFFLCLRFLPSLLRPRELRGVDSASESGSSA